MAASQNRFLDKGDKMSRQGSPHSLDHQESVGGAALVAGTSEDVQELISRRFNPRFACRMRARLNKI